MRKFLFLFALIGFAALLYSSKVVKYKSFHDARINGRIDSIYRNKDYVLMRVNKVEYKISPVPLYNSPEFVYAAKIGDRILKDDDNDGFMLLQDHDEAFEYTEKMF